MLHREEPPAIRASPHGERLPFSTPAMPPRQLSTEQPPWRCPCCAGEALPFPLPFRGALTMGELGRVPWLPPGSLCSRSWAAATPAHPGTAQRCHPSAARRGRASPAHTGAAVSGLPYPSTAGEMKCELPAGAAGSWRCRMRPRWPRRRNGRHVWALGRGCAGKQGPAETGGLYPVQKPRSHMKPGMQARSKPQLDLNRISQHLG